MAALEVSPGTTGMEKALAEIDRRIHDEARLTRSRQAPATAAEMLAAEEAHRLAGRRIADLCVAEDIVVAHLDPDVRGRACAEARYRMRASGSRAIEDGGCQPVHVRLAGGLDLRLYTRYLRPSCKGAGGRRRGRGKRGPSGVGCYPVLEHLGIRDGISPGARSDIGRATVLSGSIDEAREQLSRGGLDLHPSTAVRVAVEAGRRALALRDQAMEEARTAPLPQASSVAGRRIRISVDGGRARTRHTLRGRGIRPGKNGRRPFTLSWQEPRAITIDLLDDEGGTDRSWRPIYEVTLGDADETCALLLGLLRRIGAHLAAEVEFVADGAEWIWRRIEKVLADAGVIAERARLVLDYYHATEHISEAIELCKGLSADTRAVLFRAFRGLLLEPGGPSRVVARLRELARGRRGRGVSQAADYLERHLDHMRYADLRAESLPIGSGIVESAIRRLINLRFKSASMCWRPDHLLPLLYLRAILKAGWWDAFMRASLDGRHWLDPGAGQHDEAHDVPRRAA